VGFFVFYSNFIISMKKLLFSFVLASLCIFGIAQESENALWLRYPAISPDGSKIAFTYQGDIYSVSISGGEAKRLTIHEAYESKPVWSPDGNNIAFSSMRYDNNDVFLMASEGGEPTRLTHHSANDVVYDFSPNGRSVIYGSSKGTRIDSVQLSSEAISELYSISVLGGIEKQILTTPAIDAQCNESGDMIIFHVRNRYGDEGGSHHTPSGDGDIWTYNFENEKFSKLSSWRGEDRNPLWGFSNQVFFTSDKTGSFNVWRGSLTRGSLTNLKQVSFLEEHPVQSLSRADNGMLCFSYNGEIYTQLEPNQPKKVEVTIKSGSSPKRGCFLRKRRNRK